MKDILKAVIYGGVFVIPFLTLFVADSLFFPYITGKNFAFRILVEIVFAAWVVLAFSDVTYRPRYTHILGSFGALLAVMFVSNALGPNPIASFWSNFERMDGYVTLVHLFMYVLVLGHMFTSEKIWNRYFYVAIVSAICVSMNAIAQILGLVEHRYQGFRADATLGNASYMAVYMLFMCFIAVYLMLKVRDRFAFWALGASALLFSYMTLQTATRGTMIGIVSGLFVTALYLLFFEKRNTTLRNGVFGLLATLVIIVGLFITFRDHPIIRENDTLTRLSTMTLSQLDLRFTVWSMAYEGFGERPFFGWGQSNFNFIFNNEYSPDLYYAEAWYDRAHNIFFDWLATGGTLGVAAYIALFLSTLYYLIVLPLRNKENPAFTVAERGVLLGLLTGYAVHNLVVFDNIVSYIFFGTILALIHARTVRARVPRATSTPARAVDARLIEQVIAPCVAVVLCVVVYTVNIPNIKAAHGLIQAFSTTDPTVMINKFEEILSSSTFAKQEVREQFAQRTQMMLRSPDVPEEVKQRAIAIADRELQAQIASTPGDARAYVFAGSFYRSVGEVDKAIDHLARARELSPKKQLIIYEQGFAQLQKNDFNTAFILFEEAFKLEESNAEARNYYAMAALYAGKLGLVDEIIKTDEQKKVFALSDFAIQAVSSQKMYPRMVEMFNIRIASMPDAPQERTNLAYVLNEMGDKEGAIAVLTKAGDDIPEFKEQADGFISYLKNPTPVVTPVPAN